MGHQNITVGKWLIPVLLAVMGFASAWSSQSVADNSDTDAEIRETILRQIEAFANNDQEQAWAHASEGIKRQSGSVDTFYNMVRLSYAPVFQATSLEFRERIPHPGFQIQIVQLVGPEGKRWRAAYRMVKSDDQWRIGGVALKQAPSAI